MPDLTLDEATTFAAVAVAVLLGLAVLAAWLVKELTQKIALVVILGLLAVLVWSQRSSLQECADRVRNEIARTGGTAVDPTCRFFGRDVEIKLRR